MVRPILYGPPHQVRLPPEHEAAFQAWKLTRPKVHEADLLRELVEMGLETLQRPKDGTSPVP